jgi:hypothetical protein
MTKEVAKSGRDSEGQWVPGVSGNPRGRPKGSKNRITLLKAMAEEAVREKHTPQMLEVIQQIINQAQDGDKEAQRLVWNAIMSKGLSDSDGKVKEKVEIKIGRVDSGPTPVTIEGQIINDDEEEEEDG